MGFIARRAVWSAAAMAGLATLLIVLALLQYRWATQISDNEQERMRTQLRTAIGQFRQDLYRDIAMAGAIFQVDADLLAKHDWQRFSERYEEWLRTPANADLVSNVYLWDLHAAQGQQELKLNRQEGEFSVDRFPEEIHKILTTDPWQAPGGNLRRMAWTFDASLPGLVRPVYRFPDGWTPGRDRGGRPADRHRLPPSDQPGSGPENRPNREPELVGAVVVELNSGFLTRQLFPALVQRHLNLSGTAYHVWVYLSSDPDDVIFESGPKPSHPEDQPDAEIALIESPFVSNRQIGPRARREGERLPAEPPRQPPALRRYAMAFPAAVIPGHTNWRLAAQHPAGSLKAAVDSTLRINLLMSFGTLVVLAGSIYLLFAAMHRTRTLAKMQMEFVAGVSHELRTPVSVICSAADNLAEGVVEAKPQVQSYGQMIRSEARRLGSMVEQILLFSTGKENAARYNLQPVDAISVLESVLRDATPAIETAAITLERAINPELPHVMADGGALARCLENLVSNAIKYGANGRWIRVSAALAPSRGNGKNGNGRSLNGRNRAEVEIAVEDRGMGIAPSDLRRIFEPFYRGKPAQDSQIHGTGLGLTLARRLARAMRGEIHVESELGRGSKFTLTLPAAEMPTVAENESVNEPVHTAD